MIIEDYPGHAPAMGSSQLQGPALVAAAAEADPVTLLVTAWLSASRSENTRAAYARDIGITPPQRPCRAPSWLTWCQQQEIHPVTGITALHMTQYARQLDNAGLSPASAARKLAAISSWYAWLVRRAHITANPAVGIARPRPGPHIPPVPGLTQDQALALMHAADTAPGPQRARTAALIAVLLLTGVRLSEVTSADVGDLGTSGGRRVLWVTRGDGQQGLPLPGPAAFRIDAYLADRTRPTGDQALFATRTGRRLFATDVRRTLRRLAARASLPADQARHLGPRTIRQSFTTRYHQAGTPAALHGGMWHIGAPATQRSGPAQGHWQLPQLRPATQARDPGPALWPRGRPHCRARHPRHATRQTWPRLSPRNTMRSAMAALTGNEAPGRRVGPRPGPSELLGVSAVVAAGALGRGAVALGLQASLVRGPTGPGWDARALGRRDRIAEQGGQPGPGGLPVGQLATLLGRGHGEDTAGQPPAETLGRPGLGPFREHRRVLDIEGELDPAVSRVD